MTLVPRHALYIVLTAITFIGVGSAPSQAVIVFSGPISPSDPGDNDLETTLEVGEGSNPLIVDPRATVTVANESLEFDEAYIGSDDGFFGRMFVSGLTGRFNVESSSSDSNPAFQVGRDGNGYFELSGGATVELESSGGDAAIGFNTTSFGRMVVKDTFTFFTVGENLTVGDSGVGELEITGGAIVRTRDDTVASVTIGAEINSVGSIWVDGDGSVLQPADDLNVGVLGAGTLIISNGGLVDADSTTGVTTVGALGRVTLNGGTLAVDNLTLNGVLGGHGLVRGDGAESGVMSASATARIEAGYGQVLRLNDDVVNQGTIDIEGGEIEFLDGLTNNAIGGAAAPGRISLEDARVTFSQGLTNNGVIAVAEGASDLHGAITNNAGAAVTVARDSVATFHDAFTDNGGTLSILTGGTGLFLTDLTFTGNSTVLLQLGNEEEGGSSSLSVSGTASLAGELQLSLAQGFAPELGETYTLLTAEEITGSFIPPLLPSLEGGLALQFQNTGNTLLLSVVPGLPGDFNGDGSVDAADYTVWRDNNGTQEEYNTWFNNFGQTASSSDSSSATVPEPTSLVVLLVAATTLAYRRA